MGTYVDGGLAPRCGSNSGQTKTVVLVAGYGGIQKDSVRWCLSCAYSESGLILARPPAAPRHGAVVGEFSDGV